MQPQVSAIHVLSCRPQPAHVLQPRIRRPTERQPRVGRDRPSVGRVPDRLRPLNPRRGDRVERTAPTLPPVRIREADLEPPIRALVYADVEPTGHPLTPRGLAHRTVPAARPRLLRAATRRCRPA